MPGRSMLLRFVPVLLLILIVITISNLSAFRAQAGVEAQRTATTAPATPTTVPSACPRSGQSDTAVATAPATSPATTDGSSLSATEQNKVTICRYYELVNQGQVNNLDEVVDLNVVDRNPIVRQNADLEGYKLGLGVFRRGFPDLKFTVNDLIAEGDQVVSRVTIQGTHRGTFLGLVPTGRRVSFQGIEIYRISNGKIVDVWHVEELQRIVQLLTPPPTPCLPITATPSPTKTTTPLPTATIIPSATRIVTANPNPSFLGVRARTVDDTRVRIVEIFNGSPAVKANLHVGDDIIALDDQPISTLKTPADKTLAAAFFRTLDTKRPGDKIKLTIIRRDQQMDVEVTLGAVPPGFKVTPVAGLVSGDVVL